MNYINSKQNLRGNNDIFCLEKRQTEVISGICGILLTVADVKMKMFAFVEMGEI